MKSVFFFRIKKLDCNYESDQRVQFEWGKGVLEKINIDNN